MSYARSDAREEEERVFGFCTVNGRCNEIIIYCLQERKNGCSFFLVSGTSSFEEAIKRARKARGRNGAYGYVLILVVYFSTSGMGILAVPARLLAMISFTYFYPHHFIIAFWLRGVMHWILTLSYV